MGGGNISDITLSTSSAWRQRSEAMVEGEGEIKAEFELNMPGIVVLYWDGKIIKYDTGVVDDRLCIKVTYFPTQFTR